MAIDVIASGSTSIGTTSSELHANTTKRTPLQAVIDRPAALAAGDEFLFWWEEKRSGSGDAYVQYEPGESFTFQTLVGGMTLKYQPISAVATRLMAKKTAGTDRTFDWAIHGDNA